MTTKNNNLSLYKLSDEETKIFVESNFDKDIVSLNQFGKTQQQLLDESKHLLDFDNGLEMKPFLKLWNENYVEIKKNKPKKSKHIIMKMYDELEEIYGETVSQIIGNFLLDMIEERYYHTDNKRFSPFNKIIYLNNRKKWTKTIINVNEMIQLIENGEMELVMGNPNK